MEAYTEIYRLQAIYTNTIKSKQMQIFFIFFSLCHGSLFPQMVDLQCHCLFSPQPYVTSLPSPEQTAPQCLRLPIGFQLSMKLSPGWFASKKKKKKDISTSPQTVTTTTLKSYRLLLFFFLSPFFLVHFTDAFDRLLIAHGWSLLMRLHTAIKTAADRWKSDGGLFHDNLYKENKQKK